MKVQEFCQSLEKMLVAEADAENRMRLVSGALQKAFKVREDEVALLRVDEQNQELCFVWPKKLTKSGSIPLSARDALSVRTAREQKPLLDNKFSNTRHASVFERIQQGDPKAKEKTTPLPIQKIMSAPVVDGNRVLGIMQLSRKGNDPDSAGADFTPVELEAFAAIVAAIAHCFPLQN